MQHVKNNMIANYNYLYKKTNTYFFLQKSDPVNPIFGIVMANIYNDLLNN
jgi:hypothetical protein